MFLLIFESSHKFCKAKCFIINCSYDPGRCSQTFPYLVQKHNTETMLAPLKFFKLDVTTFQRWFSLDPRSPFCLWALPSCGFAAPLGEAWPLTGQHGCQPPEEDHSISKAAGKASMPLKGLSQATWPRKGVWKARWAEQVWVPHKCLIRKIPSAEEKAEGARKLPVFPGDRPHPSHWAGSTWLPISGP